MNLEELLGAKLNVTLDGVTHYTNGTVSSDGIIRTTIWFPPEKATGFRVIYTGLFDNLPYQKFGIEKYKIGEFRLQGRSIKTSDNKILKSEVDVIELTDMFGMEFLIDGESYGTGAVREASGDAPRPDLIPPEFILRLAEHYAKGARKYSERNWEKGIPIMRTYASMMRHLIKWAMGHTDEDHLIALVWNAIAIMFTLERIKEGTLPKSLDDRPNHMKEKE